jgi:hypothetical protein
MTGGQAVDEQLDAELLLELLELVADGGLAAVQRGRGSADAAQPADLEERGTTSRASPR